MSFHPGQLVVRTNQAVRKNGWTPQHDPTICGHVYQIKGVYLASNREYDGEFEAVTIVEYPDEPGWWSGYFRPITEDKLQVFRSLLNPVPTERVRA